MLLYIVTVAAHVFLRLHPPPAGRSCKYNGQEGLFPHATECRQKYSEHRMLALTDDGEGTYVESFLVPSACVCNILDGDAFLP